MRSLKSHGDLFRQLQRLSSCKPISWCRYAHTHRVVTPGQVLPTLSVPDHIKRPPYINESFLQKLKPKKRKIDMKTPKEIQSMQDSCRLASDILSAASDVVKEGVTTDEIDKFVHGMAIENNAYPSPLMYKGFPKSVCTSVNNIACHGIPDDIALCNGDIINVDITVYYNGFHGDTSATFLVGEVDTEGQFLVEIAKECRDTAIQQCGPGVPFKNIGKSISEIAELTGLGIIADFCGHGIGEYFHGPPDIIHVANKFKGVMEEGMTFTIEPVISEGEPSIMIMSDGWTACSIDNSRSAQFEHTVLITEHGVKILT